MRAFACFRGPRHSDPALGGAADYANDLVQLAHGDIIGRSSTAALRLDDPRVSEAHAMVSLRAGQLHLLALRGRLTVGGLRTSDIELSEGMVVRLADGVDLAVEELSLPVQVLGIEGPGVPRQPLSSVMSVYRRPRLRVEPGFHGDADAVIWGEGTEWRLRRIGCTDLALVAGTSIQVGDASLAIVPVEVPYNAPTLGGDGPLRLVARYDTVEVHVGDETTVISGVPARLLSELVSFDGPVPWETLAREIWGTTFDRDQLRPRLDMAIFRLRRRLNDATRREDIIVTTGTGHVQLVVRGDDSVEARL